MGQERVALHSTFVDLCIALLIWLFGVLVFLPLADEIDPRGLSILVSLIVFSAFTLFLARSLNGLRTVLDAASTRLWDRLEKKRRMNQKNIRNLLKATAIVAIYLLYSPLLTTFHSSINGIVIIITLLAVLWTILRT